MSLNKEKGDHLDQPLNIGRPINIADGIYWVGGQDEASNIRCNPFLVIQDGQAVLIDGGSRSDFAEVMLKVMQTGVNPKNITALIYQHYDPDLCGSMSNIIGICENPELKVLSTRDNNIFVSYYIHKNNYHLVQAVEELGMAFNLNARSLKFIETPYSHSPGSFVTYDKKTGVLFSSDLFGSFTKNSDIFLELEERCFTCRDYAVCPANKDWCPLQGVIDFHRRIMPCNKALHHAIAEIRKLDINIIAPQHGTVIRGRQAINLALDILGNLDRVGIDGLG